jgi:hypothetical protein
MKQLTKSELAELDRLWDQLARLSARKGPPMTDDEAIEVGVDALLAGITSSAGRMDRGGLAHSEAVLSVKAESPALQGILDRIAVVLGFGVQTQDPTHGLLAETFRAEAQRLCEEYDCAYSAQDQPSGHYQELAPSTGSGLALGLRTSGPAGDLFVTTGARHVGTLEVEGSDSTELVRLMRAAPAGHASTRNVTVFGRTVALHLRFAETTWALPSPFLIGLFPSRDHYYQPWPRRAGA